MSIPKTIHYCWFGGGTIPQKYQSFIDEWKNICPDYQIIKWTERNYDVNSVAFTKEAAEQNQWAFIADYARFDIVHTYGGVYLDVDVQLRRNYDAFLHEKSFFGIEKDYDRHLYVAPGLGFGAEKDSVILRELLDIYKDMHFDSKEIVASPILYNNFFEKKGFVQKNRVQSLDFGTIFPTEYFDSMDCFGKIKITKNTVSTHHYAALWQDKNTSSLLYKRCVYYFGRYTGDYVYQILKRLKRK